MTKKPKAKAISSAPSISTKAWDEHEDAVYINEQLERILVFLKKFDADIEMIETIELPSFVQFSFLWTDSSGGRQSHY